MGVAFEDCRKVNASLTVVTLNVLFKVAELIGLKTFLNEFVAYSSLTVLLQNRQILDSYNGTVIQVGDDLHLVSANRTLVGGVLTVNPQTTLHILNPINA